VGPFQALGAMQIEPVDIAPFVFFEPGKAVSDPSVIPATADATSPAVLAYVVATAASGHVVVRTRADDGVSFYGDAPDVQRNPSHLPPVVLAPSLAWEGTDVTGPSALRLGGGVWLYYAAQGGVGLARSSDGLTFTKTGQPVLAPDPTVTWETTPPHAPSVAVFPDGSWHMLYAAGVCIGEATSPDGINWRRVDADPSTATLDPVLAPSTPVDPKTLGPGEEPPFDEATVEDPLLLPRTDPTGKLQVRVLYAGYAQPVGASSRSGTIGFAARYGDAGPLSRQATPVYLAPGSSAAGPAVFAYTGGSLLYVAQLDTSDMPPTTVLAAAFDPGAGSPPTVGMYPTSP
jgi:hypothetical protein